MTRSSTDSSSRYTPGITFLPTSTTGGTSLLNRGVHLRVRRPGRNRAHQRTCRCVAASGAESAIGARREHVMLAVRSGVGAAYGEAMPSKPGIILPSGAFASPCAHEHVDVLADGEQWGGPVFLE